MGNLDEIYIVKLSLVRCWLLELNSLASHLLIALVMHLFILCFLFPFFQIEEATLRNLGTVYNMLREHDKAPLHISWSVLLAVWAFLKAKIYFEAASKLVGDVEKEDIACMVRCQKVHGSTT